MIGFVLAATVYGVCVLSAVMRRMEIELPKRQPAVKHEEEPPTFVRQIVVFAGTVGEFQDYCYRAGFDPTNARFIQMANDLGGLPRGTRIYCTGTYRLNASVWDTLQRLETRNYFSLCFDN